MKIEDGKALLISQQILDYKPIHSEYVDVSWEECDLRKWLNHEFYREAFIELYQTDIVESEVYYASFTSETEKVSCRDKIFILDNSEITRYYYDATSTNYASQKGSTNTFFSRTKTYPKRYGFIYTEGSNTLGWSVDEPNGVRPAMWISLE